MKKALSLFDPRTLERTVRARRGVLVLAIFLLILSMIVRWPGSVPRGWQYSTGAISSVVGHSVNGTTLYYPTIQYLALGYSYEITSTQGTPSYPTLGTGSYSVAFNPEQPEQAKLVGEVPANYFAALLPFLALILLAADARAFYRVYRRRHAAEKVVLPEAASETVEAVALPEPLPESEPETVPTETDEILEADPVEANPVPVADSPEMPEDEEAAHLYLPGEHIIPVVTSTKHTASADTKEIPVVSAPRSETPPTPPAAPNKIPVTPRPSAPRSIYIPHVEDTATAELDQPRSAGELKTKLKVPKTKATTPRKKTAAKKPAAKKSATRKSTAKKTTAKKAPSKARTPTKKTA